jgi:uncharacterized Zn ribbon protein
VGGGRTVTARDSNGNEPKDGDTVVVLKTCFLKKA